MTTRLLELGVAPEKFHFLRRSYYERTVEMDRQDPSNAATIARLTEISVLALSPRARWPAHLAAGC